MKQFGSGLGQKSSKGSVSVNNDGGRIRLRWRFEGRRYSLNLFAYTEFNLLEARKVALAIEQDLMMKTFDSTLSKYGGKPMQNGSELHQASFVGLFEYWVKQYKQMDCEVHTNYNSTRNMIRKWGKVSSKNILIKLNAETFCPNTYNRRLAILNHFVDWLIHQNIWTSNPLSKVERKKAKRIKHITREPFTEQEIARILRTFKENTACSAFSSVQHSYYYPFIYFLFKTGVRNAEAIGLRVKAFDLVKNLIYIKEVLARSLKSSTSAQRIRKETKNGKERVLPFTIDLKQVIAPLLVGKGPDDLVFPSPTGKAIDDNNFRERVFKKVLLHLGIRYRVLYACRHTFGSRCINQGISPVMTAFLMGNNPETALRNYTHQITLPDKLPEI